MNNRKTASQLLISAIDDQFINLVGPIGQIILGDAKHLWRKKQWHGPSALRNYIKYLSENIDTSSDRERFLQLANSYAMDAAKENRA